MSIIGKACRCEFCGEHYEIDFNDKNNVHQRFCGGECQYAGEVLPDFIRDCADNEQRKAFEEELTRLKRKLKKGE